MINKQRLNYLYNRLLFRIKKDSFKKLFIITLKTIFSSTDKINLDKLDKSHLTLDSLFLTFGTDKGYHESKKTFWNIYKDLKTRSEYKNYLEWILREKLDDDRHEMGLNYSPIYEKYCKNLKNDKLNILEVGVAAGHSLACWYYYFPNSKISGIDIKDEKFVQYEGARLKYNKLDCLNKIQVEDFKKKEKDFDIVIDDSFHDHPFFETNLVNFFPKLKKGGIYFLEDFKNSDDKLIGIRDYNAKHNRKLWKFNLTMKEIFKKIKSKEYFDHEIIKKRDLEYLFENVEDINIYYQGHPTSSIAVIKKK